MTAYELSSRIARRAYEGARIRRGLVRACGLGVLLGLIAVVAIGGGALAWLPVFAAVWAFLEWRGGALLRGGRVGAPSRATLGAALGVVATAVPRCAGLMVGEGLGLVLGLIVGTAAAGVVCTVVDRIRQPAM